MSARSLAEIRAAIPARLFERNTLRATMYLIRDLVMATALGYAALKIDPFFSSAEVMHSLGGVSANVGRWAAWGL
jgi:hypothetical protein